ncbi:DUF4747 family protein [Serratia sp. 2723]|uniref:DUF4747 family protein n=1 Tax=unclassified Serratia (in: enterobacteria) TaxID=2647522 RepID=UPI003D191713
MAIYKFYNIQLLPIESNVSEVGEGGYCRLFESIGELINECKVKNLKLSSIAVSMRGDMFFAPFDVTTYEYPGLDEEKKLIYGSFLKFDDVNELVDTSSGETEYISKGNTSSKRFNLEFVFDPCTHILAIHDTKGIPTRKPLIAALTKILDSHAKKIFKLHNLEIEELTSADSIKEFLATPKKGYKSYSGIITFSNSDSFDDALEREIVQKTEQELKDKKVAKWEANYKSFTKSVMNDLPDQAKIQMILATRYGNAEVSYLDSDGIRQKYQMEDYPVRLALKEDVKAGRRQKALMIKQLIVKAIERTRMKLSAIRSNKKILNDKE